MQTHGWLPHRVTQVRADSVKRSGRHRANPRRRTSRGVLILALALGSIGTAEAAVMSAHGNSAHARAHHAAGTTAAYQHHNIYTPWMY